MQIYSVGETELSDHDFGYLNKDAFEWFVYDYYLYGQYEACGFGAAFRKEDKQLITGGLGHCSCYGPINEDWAEGTPCSVEDFLYMQSEYIYDDVPSEKLKTKVKELLGL